MPRVMLCIIIMDSPLLDRFHLLSLCAVNQVMPDRSSVFQNWADNWSVEIKKLVSWNPRCLKLFEEIEPFTCFGCIGIDVYRPWKVCVKMDPNGLNVVSRSIQLYLKRTKELGKLLGLRESSSYASIALSEGHYAPLCLEHLKLIWSVVLFIFL